MDIWTDVMVDVETTGLNSGRNGILQIGAVRFNLETKAVDSNFFNQSLTLPTTRAWDEDTRRWWGQQKAGVLTEIQSRARPHATVIEEFAKWGYLNPGIRFWAKPVQFDFPFIDTYMTDNNLINPWKYYDTVDLNSYLKGRYKNFQVPKIEVPASGDAHNALNDCLWQLKYLFLHEEKLNG